MFGDNEDRPQGWAYAAAAVILVLTAMIAVPFFIILFFRYCASVWNLFF